MKIEIGILAATIDEFRKSCIRSNQILRDIQEYRAFDKNALLVEQQIEEIKECVENVKGQLMDIEYSCKALLENTCHCSDMEDTEGKNTYK